jgi:long-chain acyl-CoA synthetase
MQLPMSLAESLDAVARAMPAAPAVTGGGRTIGYGTFATRVARLGAALRKRGLQPGERVALFMENRAEFLDVLWACWWAGLAAVPINAKLHPREVEYILTQSGARLLFTSLSHAEGLHGLAPLLAVEDDEYQALLHTDPMPPHQAAPEELAWLFYTSGTTGKPKGAMLSHRNLLFAAHAYYADIDFLDERDAFLHAAPLSHGSGLYGVAHMLRGSHQIVHQGFEVEDVFAAIAATPNLSFFAAPTMVTRLVNHPNAASADTRNLRTISYGGAPMYVADLKRALALFGPKLYQLYGQGEAPMTISGLSKRQHADSAHPRFEERLPSAGVARTGCAFRVVDDQDRDLPHGEVGEIISRSDCVMAGYWGNPEATAATLRGGWLHTGDLGSVDADGFLTIRDRSKDMIISGGSNIYPREIEEVLLRHPAVLEASVIGSPHADWGEEVVAFIVLRDGMAATAADLDALCLANIARFKRPKQYRFLTALPKNNYGKVLKTELRARLANP